jgi:hypothetical protein
VADFKRKFRSVIVCEDIREEINGKKSLMGVFSGDIVVQSMPAVIRFAVYVEYVPDDDDGKQIDFDFRLMQDDAEMARGQGSITVHQGQSVATSIPPGLATFLKDAKFRVLVSVNKAAGAGADQIRASYQHHSAVAARHGRRSDRVSAMSAFGTYRTLPLC